MKTVYHLSFGRLSFFIVMYLWRQGPCLVRMKNDYVRWVLSIGPFQLWRFN